MENIKCGKTTGPSGIVIRRLKASGEDEIGLVPDLANCVVYECSPSGKQISYIINCLISSYKVFVEFVCNISVHQTCSFINVAHIILK